MWLQFRSIAALTWLEALRARMLVLLALTLAVVVLGAEFAAGLAVTESAEYRLAIYAGMARLATVFVVALFVTTSVVREFDDRVLDFVLSRPVTRGTWYVAKFAGHALAAVGVGVVTTVPLAVFGDGAAAASWGLSLVCELLIVIAAALTCVITLSQVTIALSAVAAFYVLSRAIAAIALMSTTPTSELAGASGPIVAHIVAAIAFVLPDLDRFTNAAWVVAGAPDWAALRAVLAQTAIYVTLLVAAGLFDLHRRNF